MNEDDRQTLALWRYAILGPLVSMRLGHGDLRAMLREAATKLYEHPLTGKQTQVSARTLETWYYRYHWGGLAALVPRPRKDRGRARELDPELVDLIIRAKREKPRRSIRRLIKILVRARRVKPGELSRSRVHRILVRTGIELAGEPSNCRTVPVIVAAGSRSMVSSTSPSPISTGSSRATALAHQISAEKLPGGT